MDYELLFIWRLPVRNRLRGEPVSSIVRTQPRKPPARQKRRIKPIENKGWVRNFVPASTSERILAEFAEKHGKLPSPTSQVGTKIDLQKLEDFLRDFKRQTGLEEVDLVELREYARFRSYGFLTLREKQFYEELASALEELIDSEGIHL